MAFEIEITASALSELKGVRQFERRRIVDAIHQQLEHQPTVPTRNRKRLDGAAPGFEHVPPLWELRVGDYRVFYDVNEANARVFVRAVRQKDQGQTTEEIIQ